MQDCYERYRLGDYDDPIDAILHSIIYDINYKVYMHNHSYYEVFLVFSGAIFHEINGESRTVSNNSIIFIRPEDFHKYRQSGNSPCGLIRLWFSRQIFDSLSCFLGAGSGFKKLMAGKLPPVITIDGIKMKKFLERFEGIFSLSPDEETIRISSLKQILLEISLLFLGCLEKSKNRDMPPWLEKLCSEMSLKDNFTRGIDRLFELSHTSREHLCRTFRKYLNITPTEYIKRIRLNYAANQLANTNRKIADICFDSGFGNISYFYECFNEVYGLPPSSFRASKLSQSERRWDSE